MPKYSKVPIQQKIVSQNNKYPKDWPAWCAFKLLVKIVENFDIPSRNKGKLGITEIVITVARMKNR